VGGEQRGGERWKKGYKEVKGRRNEAEGRWKEGEKRRRGR
jgi:hypothetical protein